MNANAKLWLEALRSGEFKQAKDQLEVEGSYCCLGVACVIAENHGVEIKRDILGQIEGANLADQPEVQKWLGLHDFEARIGSNHSVALMNDKGASFAVIADHLEAYADEIFVAEK